MTIRSAPTEACRHEWAQVLWRADYDGVDCRDYQRGCICLHCPSYVWLLADDALLRPPKPVDDAQHRWWLDRLQWKPVTPWPSSNNAGPFKDGRIEQIFREAYEWRRAA